MVDATADENGTHAWRIYGKRCRPPAGLKKKKKKLYSIAMPLKSLLKPYSIMVGVGYNSGVLALQPVTSFVT